MATHTAATTGYCTQWGIEIATPLGDVVDHLRDVHRLKLGTDYWITENLKGVIVTPSWQDNVRDHFNGWTKDTGITSIRIKERIGNKDNVLKFLK